MPPKKLPKSSAPRARQRRAVKRNTGNKPGVPRPILDPAGAAYARLLADPCNAPLAHPVYAGSEGAYVVRFNAKNTYGTASGTTTSGVLHWVPGAISPSSTYNYTQIFSEAPNPSTAATLNAELLTRTPGASFLATNASAYRCIAACYTIQWAGSELTRAGFVAVGNTSGATLLQGAAPAPGTIYPLLNFSERVPEEKLEIRWRPGSFDQTFSSIGGSAIAPSTSDLSRAGALTIFYDGLPAAGAGIVVTQTVVYEYIPSLSLGMGTTPNSRNTSNNTLDHVINWLDSKGNWMLEGAKAVGRAVELAAPVLSGIGMLAL